MRVLTIILSLLLALSAVAQRKVIVASGHKRAKLRLNEWAAIQLKGESWNCDSWRNNCSGSDSICRTQRWKVIALDEHGITGEHSPIWDTSYVYDTIPSREYAKYRKRNRGFYYHDDFSVDIEGGKMYFYIVRKAKYKITRRFPLDSIEAIAFPKNPNCAGGDGGIFLFSIFCIAGAPYAAKDSTGFNWGVWGTLTGIGIGTLGLIYRYARHIRVNRYSTRVYEIRIK